DEPARVARQRLHERRGPGAREGGRAQHQRGQAQRDPEPHRTGLALRLTLPSLVSSRKSTACAPFSLRIRVACCAMTFWKLSNFTGPASPAAWRAATNRSKSERMAAASAVGSFTRTSPEPEPAAARAAAGRAAGGGGGGGGAGCRSWTPWIPIVRPSSMARSRLFHSSLKVCQRVDSVW